MSTDLGGATVADAPGTDAGGEGQGEAVGKGGRQALYLAYRSKPAGVEGGRMTQAAAAKLAGVDTATVSRWRRTDSDFRHRESETQRVGVDKARTLARAGAEVLLGSAIRQLAGLLESEDEQVRSQVAMKVLEWNGAATALEVDIKDDRWALLQKKLIANSE